MKISIDTYSVVGCPTTYLRDVILRLLRTRKNYSKIVKTDSIGFISTKFFIKTKNHYIRYTPDRVTIESSFNRYKINNLVEAEKIFEKYYIDYFFNRVDIAFDYESDLSKYANLTNIPGHQKKIYYSHTRGVFYPSQFCSIRIYDKKLELLQNTGREVKSDNFWRIEFQFRLNKKLNQTLSNYITKKIITTFASFQKIFSVKRPEKRNRSLIEEILITLSSKITTNDLKKIIESSNNQNRTRKKIMEVFSFIDVLEFNLEEINLELQKILFNTRSISYPPTVTEERTGSKLVIPSDIYFENLKKNRKKNERENIYKTVLNQTRRENNL